MQGWFVLESGLHPTVRDRMARNLAGMAHRIDQDAMLLPDTQRNREALGLMDELIACHERILHHAEPSAARPYKPLERDVLFVTLHGVVARHTDRRDADFLADLLHSLVWAQGLPNTNHRSTLALVNLMAFHEGRGAPPTETQRPAADRFITASKPLIREKEFAPGAAELKRRHHGLARDYVDALLVL